jgi:hypothetical protein
MYSTAAMASAHKEAEGFTRRIALHEGELTEVRWARDTAKENSQGLFDATTDAER